MDARGKSLYSGEHWVDSEQFDGRASLKVRPGQQGLYLSRLSLQDAGQYRCRVDFKLSPTRNLRINLQIVGQSFTRNHRINLQMIGHLLKGNCIINLEIVGQLPTRNLRTTRKM